MKSSLTGISSNKRPALSSFQPFEPNQPSPAQALSWANPKTSNTEKMQNYHRHYNSPHHNQPTGKSTHQKIKINPPENHF
jgi:hypothetical protein